MFRITNLENISYSYGMPHFNLERKYSQQKKTEKKTLKQHKLEAHDYLDKLELLKVEVFTE